MSFSSPSYELSKLLSPLIGDSYSFVMQFFWVCLIHYNQNHRPWWTHSVVWMSCPYLQRSQCSWLLLLPVADDTLPSLTNLSVLSLLEFCPNATYLCFCGHFFKQTYETAMGSPVSGSITNLVMEDVKPWPYMMSQLPFWKRYVDDACTVVPINRVQHLLQHLNTIESTI